MLNAEFWIKTASLVQRSSFSISLPAVSFLLHFPSDCSASTLSSTVPCAARTFLTRFREIPKPGAATAARRSRYNYMLLSSPEVRAIQPPLFTPNSTSSTPSCQKYGLNRTCP